MGKYHFGPCVLQKLLIGPSILLNDKMDYVFSKIVQIGS